MDIVIELLYQIAHTDKHMGLVNGVPKGRGDEFKAKCGDAVKILQAALSAVDSENPTTTGEIYLAGKTVELRIEHWCGTEHGRCAFFTA